MSTFIRTTSHRSRDKMHRAIGQPRSCYLTSPGQWPESGFYEVDTSKLETVLAITGITKARIQDPERYETCWKL